MVGTTQFDRFETARLIAERIDHRHLNDLVDMHGNTKVMATLGGVRSPENTAIYIADSMAHWERYGFGLWIFQNRAGYFVGRGGVRHTEIDGVDQIEIAYALMPGFWDQGIATEMGRQVVAIARDLTITKVVAFATVENKASQNVMNKLGFIYSKDFVFKQQNCALYHLSII